MQEIKTKKLKIGELINEFDGKHNSFVISFQASTTNANDLQNFIHNNSSSTTFIEIEGLRDGKELKNRWGLLTLEIGDLKLLVLGHLVCLCTDGDCCQFAHFTGEDKLEPMNSFGVCCKVYSHDALGSKSARFRVEKSHEFDTVKALKQNTQHLKEILEKSDTPRSSSSTTESPQIPKYSSKDIRKAGGKLTAHDLIHFPGQKPKASFNKIAPNSTIGAASQNLMKP